MGATAVGGMVVATVVTMPALVLRTGKVRAAIEYQNRIYAAKSSAVTYLASAGHPGEVGWWLMGAGALGVVLLLATPRSRLVTLGWLASAVPLLVVLYQQQYQPFRNALPVVPFLAIGAATLAGDVGAQARRLLHTSRPVRWAISATLVVVLAAMMVVQGSVPTIRTATGTVDSRTRAVDWLVAHTHRGEHVLVAEELAILPSELARIPDTVTEAPTAGPRARAVPPGTDILVTSPFLGKGVLNWEGHLPQHDHLRSPPPGHRPGELLAWQRRASGHPGPTGQLA